MPETMTMTEVSSRHVSVVRPSRPIEITPTLLRNFWARTEKRADDECWPWKGAVLKRDGRGFCPAGRRGRLATHVSLAIAGRPLTPGMCACHSCNNANCVNPHHLYEATAQQNTADAIRDGRVPYTWKTHCKNGHELSGENLYDAPPSPGRPWKSRVCRECKRIARKVYEDRRTQLGTRRKAA